MIRNIKVHSRRIPWEKIREIFVLFLFCGILVVAAFGWGVIYENRRHEGLAERVYFLESNDRDQNGKITALEGKPAKKQ